MILSVPPKDPVSGAISTKMADVVTVLAGLVFGFLYQYWRQG